MNNINGKNVFREKITDYTFDFVFDFVTKIPIKQLKKFYSFNIVNIYILVYVNI